MQLKNTQGTGIHFFKGSHDVELESPHWDSSCHCPAEGPGEWVLLRGQQRSRQAHQGHKPRGPCTGLQEAAGDRASTPARGERARLCGGLAMSPLWEEERSLTHGCFVSWLNTEELRKDQEDGRQTAGREQEPERTDWVPGTLS